MRQRATWAANILVAGYRVVRRNGRGKPCVALTLSIDGGVQHGRAIDVVLTADEARGWAATLIGAADLVDANADFLR
jgi:hypothetical protein